MTTGVGGAATVSGTGTNIGGAGGDITIKTSAGGTASGGTTNTPGVYGTLFLLSGGITRLL